MRASLDRRPVLRWLIPAVAAALWLAALALPALEVSGGPVFRGYSLLTRGWQGAEAGVFAWYANPLFLAALAAYALRAYRTAAVIAVMSLVLALTSFAAGELAEGRGVALPPFSLRAGFYVWLMAPPLLAVWCWAAAAGWLSRAAPKTPGSRD